MVRQVILQRTRFFIGAEGQSEQSFIKWFQQLADQQGLHIHLDCAVLDGGGYSKMLNKAVAERKRKEQYTSQFKSSILLVDSDRSDHGDDLWSSEQLKQEASKKKFTACLQIPNLEGLLLRMFPKKERIKLSGRKEAAEELKKIWPNYEKPEDTLTLAKKFSLSDLLRTARADPELNTLLSMIGLNNGR